MDKIGILKQTEECVKTLMENSEPGHDFLHVQRVRKMALKIVKTLQSDVFLVGLLALLHDIEDQKFDNNSTVEDILNRLNIDKDYKDRILYILPYLSFSKYPRLPESFPVEGKIVSDADRLDAIGAIGIARAFSYGGNKNRRMYGNDDSTIKHFDDKLLKLDQYLYFDISKEIAEKRMNVLKLFYKEFLEEIE